MTRVDDPRPFGAKAKNLASRRVTRTATGLFARRIAPNRSARRNSDRPSFWPPSQFFTGQRRRL